MRSPSLLPPFGPASNMDSLGITERVVRNNVFPLVLILLGIPLFFLGHVIYRLVKEGALDTTLRFLKCLCIPCTKVRLSRPRARHRRRRFSALTGAPYPHQRRVYSVAGVIDETSQSAFSGLETRLPPYTGGTRPSRPLCLTRGHPLPPSPVYFEILKSEKERRRAVQREGSSVRIKPINGGPAPAGGGGPEPSPPHGVRTEETLYETPHEAEGQAGSAVAPARDGERGEGAAPKPPPPPRQRRRAPMLKQLKQLRRRRRRQEFVEYKLWPPVEEGASPPTAQTQDEGEEGLRLLSSDTGSGSDIGFPVREPPQRGWSSTTQASRRSSRLAPPGRAGKPKLTWEVIRDKGFLHTYRLESNPRYRDALRAAAEQNVEELA